jgi:uncharacterized protein (TIGR03083 family)
LRGIREQLAWLEHAASWTAWPLILVGGPIRATGRASELRWTAENSGICDPVAVSESEIIDFNRPPKRSFPRWRGRPCHHTTSRTLANPKPLCWTGAARSTATTVGTGQQPYEPDQLREHHGYGPGSRIEKPSTIRGERHWEMCMYTDLGTYVKTRVNTDLDSYITALDQTWSSIMLVCSDLTPEQWDTPTALPGWSVKDNVSHIIAEESLMLGDPAPDHKLTKDMPHLRTQFNREAEVPIDYRRSIAGTIVLAELQTIATRRLEALRRFAEPMLDNEIRFAGRSMPLRNALGLRTFDSWIHGQDIRRALGRPGDLDTLAAHLTLQRLVASLSQLAEDVPAAAGRSLVLNISGPTQAVATLRLGADPALAEGVVGDVDATIACGFQTFVELSTGRASYADRTPNVMLSGDQDLAAQLLRHFSVTP